MKLIINIPALNEEESIEKVIRRAPTFIEGIDEIALQVVDDGSTDRTIEIARNAGVKLIVSHGRNRGVGAAFRSGVDSALQNGADIMVNIDADGQFPPEDISKFTDLIIRKRADIVIGSRFGIKRPQNMPWIKSFLNRIAASIIGQFLNYEIEDITCGFRAYSREALLRLNLLSDFTYTQETVIDAISKNLTVKWVPVEVTYFKGRDSRVVKSIPQFVYNSFVIIIRTVRDARPVLFFGTPGLILIALALIIGLVFLVYYFINFKVSPFRTWLMLGGGMLLIGIQLLIFSLIADMIRSNRKITEEQLYLAKKEKYREKSRIMNEA